MFGIAHVSASVRDFTFLPVKSRTKSPILLIFQPEAGLHRHLILRHLSVRDMTADLGDLKPAQMTDRFPGFGNCTIDRFCNAFLGGSDEFDDFVNMLRHTDDPPAGTRVR